MAPRKEIETTVLEVNVKKINPNAKLPTYAHDGDACFDLYAAQDVVISPGETKIVSTGLVFEVPAGHVMRIYPRSGISANRPLRLPNSPATIDAPYRGDIGIIIENTAPVKSEFVDAILPLSHKEEELSAYKVTGRLQPVNTVLIRKGERIAQADIIPIPKVVFNEVTEVTETNRGGSGYGGSGVK